MNKVLLGGVVVIIIIAVIVLVGGKNIYNAPPNATPNPTSEATTPNSIIIQNFSFNPQTLTVKVGDTVTWTNNDSAVHNIKSSSFNSTGLNTNDTFKFTFNTPGTFSYNCGIHPSMTGTIIVK